MDIPDMSDLVPELICLGVDAVICGILYKVYSDTNSTIEAVKVKELFSRNLRWWNTLKQDIFSKSLKTCVWSKNSERMKGWKYVEIISITKYLGISLTN